MLWHPLTDINQLHAIIQDSKEQSSQKLTVLLFKHSTRCSISSMALNRFENKWKDHESIKTYYLDLLNHRDVSNEIASLLGVEHASPQVLLVRNGECFYHNSHTSINVTDILEAIGNK